MRDMNKSAILKILKGLCIFGVVILVIALFGAYMIWGWILKPELAARCDNGVTIWRRNPGAYSSYLYEVRGGDRKSGIKLSSSQLDDYVNTSLCLFLDGG